MDIPSNLPRCLDLKESERGDCYYASTSDRKVYVVYENYRGCLNSWLATPGFVLLPTWVLATIYLLILLYMFVGVALASDKFMASIEVICGSTRRVKRKCPITGETKVVRVPVWNWVVANVSLMAVGSSAPEILLAMVESIVRLGKPAGELGPSTIVGSAAYNLMMISAVCTAALPTGVIKHVKHLRVFITTAIISMWAYVWMLIVYLWWSPSEVTVAEALLTLLQFVLLLVIGWAVDVKVWQRARARHDEQEAGTSDAVVAVEATSTELAALEAGFSSHSHSTSTAQQQLERRSALRKSASFGETGQSLQKPPPFKEQQSMQAQQQQQQQKPVLLAAWQQQFVDAIEYDSKAAADGEEPGGVLGLIMHFMSIFWKLCMATTPPEWWLGGYPCFFACLVWIIAQVVIVDEVAMLLGCVVGLSPLVIGMSLVAMGTSLPDTFCSRTAALKDSHADAAVGNITGSNAANVFLGLGLPWLISSAYYAVRGEKFCSDSGALAFSVLVFSGTAVVWLAVLFLRRFVAGGELGANSTFAKWGLFFLALCLWGVYLTFTGLVSEGVWDDSWLAVQAGSNACSPAAAA